MFQKFSRNQLFLIGLSLFTGIVLVWGCVDAIIDSQDKNPKMRPGGTSEYRVDIQTK